MKTDAVERLLSSFSVPPPAPEIHRNLLDAARLRIQGASRRPGEWGARIGVAASLLFCVLCFWSIGVSRKEGPESPGASARQEDVEKVLRKLGSEDPSSREEAHRWLLKALGEDPQLVSVLKSRADREGDPEVRARMRELLRQAADTARKTAELPLTQLRLVEHAVLRVAGEETFLRAAFSPDGRFLAALTFGDHATLRLWSVQDLREIASARVARPSIFRSLSFAPDGKALAVVGVDEIVFYDARSLTKTHSLLPSGKNRRFYGFSIHPDGTRAAYSEAGQSKFSDPSADLVVISREGKELRRLRGVNGAIEYLRWSPEGRFLLVDGHQEGYRGLVFNAETLEEAGTLSSRNLELPGDWCLGAAFLTSDTLVATRSIRDIAVWEWKNGQQELRASLLLEGGRSTLWSAGPILATTQGGGLFVGAFLNASSEIRTIGKLDQVDPASTALSPDGRWLLVTREYQDTQPRVYALKPD